MKDREPNHRLEVVAAMALVVASCVALDTAENAFRADAIPSKPPISEPPPERFKIAYAVPTIEPSPTATLARVTSAAKASEGAPAKATVVPKKVEAKTKTPVSRPVSTPTTVDSSCQAQLGRKLSLEKPKSMDCILNPGQTSVELYDVPGGIIAALIPKDPSAKDLAMAVYSPDRCSDCKPIADERLRPHPSINRDGNSIVIASGDYHTRAEGMDNPNTKPWRLVITDFGEVQKVLIVLTGVEKACDNPYFIEELPKRYLSCTGGIYDFRPK